MILPEYLNKKNRYYEKYGKVIFNIRKIQRKNYNKITFKKTKKHPAIFLEPHSDDIALSISGTLYDLYRKGFEIIVYNIFSFTPPSKSPLNDILNFTERDYESIRKIENDSAFRKYLDCKLITLNLKSSKYRGYRTFCQNPKDDDSSIEIITSLLKEINIKYPNSDVFIPAGIGNHVDHVLVRNLALKILKKPILMYEDYPYVKDTKYYLQGINRIKEIGGSLINEKININIKKTLVNFYNTQFKETFLEKEKEIADYFQGKYGGYYERYWKI